MVSLAQEKRILHQVGETQQQQQKQQPRENNDMSHKRIYFKQRNWEVHNLFFFFNILRSYHKIGIYTYFEILQIIQFSYTQSIVPKSSSSKGIHDLLRSLKDTKKLRNKGTASGELVDNQTSQDSLKTSIKVIKIGPFPHLFLTTCIFFF